MVYLGEIMFAHAHLRKGIRPCAAPAHLPLPTTQCERTLWVVGRGRRAGAEVARMGHRTAGRRKKCTVMGVPGGGVGGWGQADTDVSAQRTRESKT